MPGASYGYSPSPFNFCCDELRILSASGSSASGAFTGNGVNSIDCLIFNEGSAAAYVLFSSTPNPTALNAAGGANGTTQYYCAAGAYLTVSKGGSQPYFAAITDTGTTTLVLHAGRGS